MRPLQKPGAFIIVLLLAFALFTGARQATTQSTENPFAANAFFEPYILARQTPIDYSFTVDIIVDAPRNRIYRKYEGEIVVIDARAGVELATISSVSSPGRLALNPDASRLYVTGTGPDQDGRITVVDTGNFNVIASHAYPTDDVRAMDVDAANRIYLAPFVSGGAPAYAIDVMDGDTGDMLAPIPLGTASTQYQLAVAGSKLYVGRGAYSSLGHLYKFDLSGEEPALEASAPLLNAVQALLVWPDDAYLALHYASGAVEQYDPETLEEIRAYPDYYNSAAVSGDGANLLLHNGGDYSMSALVEVINPQTGESERRLIDRQPYNSSRHVSPLRETGIALFYPDYIRAFTPAYYGVGLPLVMKGHCFSSFVDSFDNPNSGWPVGDTGSTLYRYIDGEYNIHHRQGNWWTAVTRGDVWDDSNEVRVSGRVAEKEGVWGLVFGLNQDWSEFYTFEILPAEQRFVVLRFSAHTGWSLLHQGSASVIHPGNAVNTLSIRGNWRMDLRINGYTFYSFNDHKSGRVGLSGGSFDAFTDLRYDDYGFSAEGCPTIPLNRDGQGGDLFISTERPSLRP